MMRRIRTKLRSEEGASLILALLFFLLCMMVGASVVAAASSNAGKLSKRQVEQQEYFTISSALQLVCDRLAEMEYRAQASVSENEKPEWDSTDTSVLLYKYKITTYKQESGIVKFDANNAINETWRKVFPKLQKELDYLFAEQFTEGVCNGYHGSGRFQDDDKHVHSTLGGSDAPAPKEHILTIQVDGTTLSGGAPAELTKEVEVKVSLGKSGAVGEEKYQIFLEARLAGGGGGLVMKAELKPTSGFPHINDPNTFDGPSPSLSEKRAPGLRWKLVRIYRENIE